MTVIAKPIGSGNWAALRLQYSGPQMAPFVVQVGERFELAGVTWRVCEVQA
ncbi:MAG: hypothetical protein ING77_12935 [Rhodocyclaceae bacterium]|nr:hypothetical protein [Rhodocyclaceae bacterium]